MVRRVSLCFTYIEARCMCNTHRDTETDTHVHIPVGLLFCTHKGAKLQRGVNNTMYDAIG